MKHGLLTLALLFVSQTMACGASIREAANTAQSQSMALLGSVTNISIGHPGPYHLALRLSEGALSTLVQAALIGQSSHSTVTAESGTGLNPFFSVTKTQVKVLPTCDGCIAITMDLSMGFAIEEDTPALLNSLFLWFKSVGDTQVQIECSGRLRLKQGKLGAKIDFQGLQLDALHLQGGIEGDFINPTSSIEGYLQTFLDDSISDSSISASLPLPKTIEIGGEAIPIASLGLWSIPRQNGLPGEIILGANTLAPVTPELTLDGQHALVAGSLEAGQYAIVLEQSFLEAISKRSTANAHAPSPGNDRQSYVQSLQHLKFVDGTLKSQVSLYQIGKRPWHIVLPSLIDLHIQDGQLLADSTHLFPKEKKGWRGRAKRSQQLPYSAEVPARILRNLGPTSVDWIEDRHAHLKAELTAVVVGESTLTLVGKVGL